MYRPKSTWLQASQKATRVFPKVSSGKHYDVIVVGADIVGSTTAYLLKRQGKKVGLIEGNRVGSGVTAYSTAKLSAQQGCLYQKLVSSHGKEKASLYYNMNINGIDAIDSLTKSLNIDCDFERKSHTTWTTLEANMSMIQKEYDVCCDLGVLKHAPELREELPSSIGALKGITFEHQAQFNPFKYCIGMAEKVDGEGCNVFEESRVTNVTSDKIHKVTVNDLELTSDHVVLATHLPILDRSMHFAILEPSRSICVAFELKEGSNNLQNMSINAATPTRSLRMYGNTLIVAGEGFKMGEESSEEKYKIIEKWTREHFDVVKTVAYWSAMDYVSADHVPFIGQLYRGSPTIYTATGFSKWGLASGVTGAQIIADLVQNKPNPFADFVDAKRWDLIHQWKGLALENIHVSKHLISDKIKHRLKADEIVNLKVGEGKICKG